MCRKTSSATWYVQLVGSSHGFVTDGLELSPYVFTKQHQFTNESNCTPRNIQDDRVTDRTSPRDSSPATSPKETIMTEAEAKKQLRQMLGSLTIGSLLHLLSELFSESAKRAQRMGDVKARKQFQDVASTLFVMGLGVDAASPR